MHTLLKLTQEQSLNLCRPGTVKLPYCPNSQCIFHHNPTLKFALKRGFYTSKSGIKNQRYQCVFCGKFTCDTYFTENYWKRHLNINKIIFYRSINSMSNYSISRELKVSEKVIRLRKIYLSRQALLRNAEFTKDLKLDEPIVYDGFESFTYSQYNPCNLNLAIGKESLFIYLQTFSPLNRKGAMTQYQKIKRNYLEKKHGKYPPDSLQKKCLFTLEELKKKFAGKSLFLYSDEHQAYEIAVSRSENKKNINHIQISSKKIRDRNNELFAVNHHDLLLRRFTACNARQTIAFKKNEASFMDSMILMMVHKNYMRPKFYKKETLGESKRSPAMELGVTEHIMGYKEMFGIRKAYKKELLNKEEENYYQRRYSFSRNRIQEYKSVA